MSTKENPYQLFTGEILCLWKSQHVSYVKVEELAQNGAVTFYELIPDSELLDGGDHDTLYPINSDEVQDMIVPINDIKFVVHRVYLEED